MFCNVFLFNFLFLGEANAILAKATARAKSLQIVADSLSKRVWG